MSFLDKQFNQKVSSFFLSQDLFSSYQKSLEAYWQCDFNKALSLLTKEIENLEGSEASSLYYRMWIEILAEKDDKPSMMALLKHLTVLSHAGSMDEETLLALRGLIHLELDEIKLCEHLIKLTSNKLKNPYCLEFQGRFHMRFTADGKENLLL